MLLQKDGASDAAGIDGPNWKSHFEETEWVDPNTKNLVAEGE
jgi:carbamoyl-phosphate synthase/aspartate carbamoyltransferase